MESENGELFVKQLAGFVRTHEKALANALQSQRREPRHRSSQSASAVTIPPSSTLPDRPSTSSSTSSLAAALSLGNINFSSQHLKSAKLALTPHHLFYLLARFEELSIKVGPMKIRLENLHDSSTSANYVSFLGNSGRSGSRNSDVGSIHSVSSVRSVVSGMSALWASIGLGASISAARTERQKATALADLKYLYSAFTKIPCLRLAPDSRARLISGYEEFPFDSAVPLYVFKNLQALEVCDIDFRQFFGWDRLADQLRSLSLKRAGIEDPADIIIDIILDDMDKRRHRTSKTHASPAIAWALGSTSPRRSPTISHPELHRSATVPSSSYHQNPLAEMRVGSLTSSEHAVEDSDETDGHAPGRLQNHSDVPPRPPPKDLRPRSNSPTSRPTTSRKQSNPVRPSHRIIRSGSGSSHSSLSDHWHTHPSKGNPGTLLAMGILPASKWRFLRHLSLADNSMTSIPQTSLAPLSNTLYSLDLSSNLFSQIPDTLATLTALRALNLSHCMIDSLLSLTRNPLPAITVLNVRANRLRSLAGIEKLYPLERLDVRDNRLADPLELARLTGVPDIREIWVDGNPFTRTHRDFRTTIFNLFRKTPGYTDDVLIDGSGPTYSEKRSLVERAPIPDSVPVVKPIAPEVPTVDLSKPHITYSNMSESASWRRDRPVPTTMVSETNTNSARRRKTPRRRIVDLATGDTPPSPTSADIRPEKRGIVPNASDLNGLYRLSDPPKMQLLSAMSPNDGRLSSDPKADRPRVDLLPSVNASSEHLSHDTGNDWREPQTWDTGGDLYRRKIEALRNSVGQDYLSALSEETWDSNGGYKSPGIVSPSALGNTHPTHTPPAQAIHSGHTLG